MLLPSQSNSLKICSKMQLKRFGDSGSPCFSSLSMGKWVPSISVLTYADDWLYRYSKTLIISSCIPCFTGDFQSLLKLRNTRGKFWGYARISEENMKKFVSYQENKRELIILANQLFTQLCPAQVLPLFSSSFSYFLKVYFYSTGERNIWRNKIMTKGRKAGKRAVGDGWPIFISSLNEIVIVKFL